MSTMTISLETDTDGFISQECPSCLKLFKVKFGEGSSQPVGHCPYCGHEGRSCWWTREQADYIGGVASKEIVGPMLNDMARKINGGHRASGMIRMTARVGHASQPVRPNEPDTPMATMTFACCKERIKHDGQSAKLHCIICGELADAC